MAPPRLAVAVRKFLRRCLVVSLRAFAKNAASECIALVHDDVFEFTFGFLKNPIASKDDKCRY